MSQYSWFWTGSRTNRGTRPGTRIRRLVKGRLNVVFYSGRLPGQEPHGTVGRTNVWYDLFVSNFVESKVRKVVRKGFHTRSAPGSDPYRYTRRETHEWGREYPPKGPTSRTVLARDVGPRKTIVTVRAHSYTHFGFPRKP